MDAGKEFELDLAVAKTQNPVLFNPALAHASHSFLIDHTTPSFSPNLPGLSSLLPEARLALVSAIGIASASSSLREQLSLLCRLHLVQWNDFHFLCRRSHDLWCECAVALSIASSSVARALSRGRIGSPY